MVEGLNDKKNVLEALPDAHCVVTNGTRMNNRVKMDLLQALAVCDVVFLLTDPDEAGDTLAAMVWRQQPTLERVLLDKKKCMALRFDKVKVGVEHCDPEYLSQVLHEYIKHYERVS